MLIAAALLAGVLLGVPGADGATVKEGVSRITIIPSRVYEDLPSFTVRVTTTGPTRPPNRLYSVGWQSTALKSRREGCTSLSGKPGQTGGVNKTFQVRFRPVASMGGKFCVGPAKILISSWNPRTPGKLVPVIKRLDFRIYRAP